MSLSISVSDYGSGAAFQREFNHVVVAVKNRAGLLKVCGRRGANELRAHFRMRNRTPNKLGGQRTNFWQGVADKVQSPVLVGQTAVRISINHPAIAQKVYGGTIRPKTAKALTIPVDPEAHGRTVATFQQETGIQLFLIPKRGGGLTNLLGGIVGSGDIKVFYVLVASVDQPPDPNALPDQDQFEGAILDEANQYLNREIQS